MQGLLSLFSELIRCETELWNAVDDRLRAAHDLPLAHFEPMQVIASTPNCRVREIAESLAISVGGTSKLVDRLESAGLCVRLEHPSDRRSSLLDLTTDGRQLLAAAEQTVHQVLEVTIGLALSVDQQAALTRRLTELRSTIASSD